MRRAWIVPLVLLLDACSGADPGTESPAGAAGTGYAFGAAPSSTCPEGSNPDAPGPADQARPDKMGGPMAFDRESNLIVLFEAGMPDTADVSRTWTFDVCTNTWTRMAPKSEPPPGELPQRLVYDPATDRTLAFAAPGGVWAYDADADAWRDLGSNPDLQNLPNLQPALDPVTGLVLVRDGSTSEMFAFDPRSARWSTVSQGETFPPLSNGPMHGQVLAYDPTIDRLVLFVEGHGSHPTTWLFDPRNHTWTETEAEAPQIMFVYGDLVNGQEIAFDETVGRVVIVSARQRYVFDGPATGWTTERLDMARRIGGRIVFDPVNGRLVWVGGDPQGRSVVALAASENVPVLLVPR
jgi:hypothetical protein